jgi:hypothetical protein
MRGGLQERRWLLTLSPRSMNFRATCLPVVLSKASCTKPNVPLFKSLICGSGARE